MFYADRTEFVEATDSTMELAIELRVRKVLKGKCWDVTKEEIKDSKETLDAFSVDAKVNFPDLNRDNPMIPICP